MPFKKRNSVFLFAILTVFALFLALPGCKEGTDKSPVSALLTGMGQDAPIVDVSGDSNATNVLSGKVSSQNTSENLANIDVKLFLNKQQVGATKTTSDGQFYFSKLPPGLYEAVLSSSDESYNQTSYIVRILDDGTTQPTEPEVKLTATNPERLKIQAKLEGEVVLAASGQKLANINVELEDSKSNIISAVLTNANGQFSFDGVGTGTYQLKVGKASIYEIAQQGVTVKDDGVVTPRYSIISLAVKPTEQRFPISGQVASQNTSENLSNIMVSLFYNSQLIETTYTTADGQFYFARQIPGFYDMTFSSNNGVYKTVNYALRLLDDGTTQPAAPIVNLELTNPGTAPINAKIEGEVIDSTSGTKLSNINIELVKADGTLHSTALTNANGYFYFDGLSSAEVYTVKAGKASNYVENQQNVTVRNDGVVSPRYSIMRLSIKPIEKFTISGTVKSSDNKSIINAEIRIYDDVDLTISSAQATRTTGDGTFIFDGLNEAKIYYLKVTETPTSEASQVYPVRVLANGDTTPKLAEIFVSNKDNIVTYDTSGTVYDVFTGGPLEYASFKFDDGSSLLTDKNGLFLAKNLLPGNYNVSITKYGYESTKAGFTVSSDGTTRPTKLSFPMVHTLKSGYGSIAGRFINIGTGEGVANLFVRLYKWQLYSQEKYVTIVQNGTPTDVLVTDSRYGYDDAVVLTTKTSNTNNTELSNELAGSFKLTHLEPGKYLVYITSSTTEPTPTTYSTTKSSATFNWPVPNSAADAGFKAEIRSLEVLAGQTTYWTNYEQEYK